MKVLIKSNKSRGAHSGASVIVVRDPAKQKEMMRLLTGRSYARAITYLLKSGGIREKSVKKKKGKTSSIDLVLTPNSMHWDLIGK